MRVITFLAAKIAIAFLFASSAIADAGITATYKASADDLWNTVDFHAPFENFMPPIKSSSMEGKGIGARKTNILKDGGGKVYLQLAYYNPKIRGYNYVIRSSPLPLKDYVGEVRVTDLGDGRAQLTWRGFFGEEGVEQAKADEIMQGFYEAVATGIGKKFPRE